MNKRIQKKRHNRGPFYTRLCRNPKNKKRDFFRYRCVHRCIVGYNWRVHIYRWQNPTFDWETTTHTVSVHEDRLLTTNNHTRTIGPRKSRKLYTRSY